MKCFFACFTSCEHRKRRHWVETPSKRHRDRATLKQALVSRGQEVTKEPAKQIPESKENVVEEEVKLGCNVKRKVTFDLNVKEYKDLAVEEVVDDLVVESVVEKESDKNEEQAITSKSISNFSSSNVAPYPPNYRYEDFANEEYEDLDLGNSYLDHDDDDEEEKDNGGDDDQVLVQEESSESLFSVSIDSRKQLDQESSESLFSLSSDSRKAEKMDEKEVTSPLSKCGASNEDLNAVGSDRNARDRNLYVDSVLENLTQWKAVKARATSLPLQHDKENISEEEQDFDTGICVEPSFKVLNNKLKANSNQKKLVDMAVDTSLSSWLVGSETTSMSKDSANSVGNSPSGKASSPRSHEDRQILGILTIGQLNQLSASTSLRCSRNRSPDEAPVTGTVGSYWKRTGRTMDSDSGSFGREMAYTKSKNMEDENLKWTSISFEARLERASNNGIVQV